MPPPHPQLEVCVASLADAVAAWRAGADRLELNSALELGGLTPSLGLTQAVVDAVGCQVVAMLRPRPAGFCYGADDLNVMRRDAETLAQVGVDGLVLGILTPDHEIDQDACRRVIEGMVGVDFIFHRAFDVAASRQEALEVLVELGFARVLTSGGASTAIAGSEELTRIVAQSRDRIEIMAGSGIRPENIKSLYLATGCHALHGSFSRIETDSGGSVCDSTYPATDPASVAAAKRLLTRA